MASSIHPLKFGIKYKPSQSPCLVLEYEKDGKRRRRVMPVRDLATNSNAVNVAQSLMKGHPMHLNPSRISKDQITRLVQQLIDKLPVTATSKKVAAVTTNPFITSTNNKSSNPFSSSQPVSNTNPFSANTDSDIALKRDLAPLANKLGPLLTLAPLGTKHNLQFGTGSAQSKPLQPVISDKPKSGLGSQSMLAGKGKNRSDDLLDDTDNGVDDDSYGEDFLEDSDEDLNKLDDGDLNMKKAKMNVEFEKK